MRGSAAETREVQRQTRVQFSLATRDRRIPSATPNWSDVKGHKNTAAVDKDQF